MKRLLHIETATRACSVSISEGEQIIAIKESHEANIHSKKLGLFIEELLNKTRFSIQQLDGISVSIGPGSYTGLRIGVSTAKGLAYGGDIPVIALETLNILAMHVLEENKIPEHSDIDLPVMLCPMIDARRMEVYCKLLNTKMLECSKVEAKIINQNSFMTELANNRLIFFGDGSEKCREIIDHHNALFLTGIFPSSRYMLEMALKKLASKDFVDTAYFEPFYLKDFIATVPRNKVLSGKSGKQQRRD